MENPLLPGGLFPDPEHDLLFEKRGRLRLFETANELFRPLQIRKGTAAPGARGHVFHDSVFLLAGEKTLQVGRQQLFDIMAHHLKSPSVRIRPSFNAVLAR